MSAPEETQDVFHPLPAEGFVFACHPGVACFNQCCRQLKLLLTPYDVLRLKRRLGMDSGEFVERHANVRAGQNGWPLPFLQMRDDEERTCPFLGEAGCTVYEDRPGACRTYPLGRASKGGRGKVEENFFLVKEPHCQGFQEGTCWSPADWTKDQGLEPYVLANDRFLPLLTRSLPSSSQAEAQKKLQMFFMAAYNLDKFRQFLFQSRLHQMLEVPPARLDVARERDEELLNLALDWLGLSLFGDQTLRLKQPETS